MTTTTEPEVHWASYSALGTHRSCPQKWYYGYVRGLTRMVDAEPACERDFGSWWHMLRAAEAMERGRVLGSLQWTPRELKATDDAPRLPGETATVLDVLSIAADWWEKQDAEYQAEFVNRMGEPLHVRLLGAYERWRDQWEDEIAYERPLAVELSWGRMLPTVRDFDGEVVDPNTRLVGYVDEVYQDTRRNVIVARDHKSSKTLGTQSTVDDMMDSQLQLYAWGASPTVSEWGVGKIEATAYDRMRSVAPHPPQLTLSGRLKVANGQEAIGQCDLRTYVEWARGEDGMGVPFPGTKKDGTGAGFYTAEDHVIERMSSPSFTSAWFQRTLTPLSTHLIKAHLRAAIFTAIDQQRTRARSEATREAGRNLGSACRWCDFDRLCRAEMVGGSEGTYDLSIYNLREKG